MKALLGAIAALFVATSANAQPSHPLAYKEDGIVSSITHETIVKLLSNAGYEFVIVQPPNGKTVYLAATPRGLRILFSRDACDTDQPDVCHALLMMVLLEPGQVQATLEGVNNLNNQQAIAQVSLADEERLVFSRYLITASGVAEANLQFNLGLFESVVFAVLTAPALMLEASADAADLAFSAGAPPLANVGDLSEFVAQAVAAGHVNGDDVAAKIANDAAN